MDLELVWTVMKWPIVACLLLPAIFVYYGLHIVKRQIIFVDLALAQVAALGTSVGLIMGFEPEGRSIYPLSLAFTLAGAFLFTLMRKLDHRRVPHEALIGIIYVVAAAAGLLVLSASPEGNEELKRVLVGDVLLAGKVQVLKTAGIFALVGAVHVVFRRQFLALSFGAESGESETAPGDGGRRRAPSLWWEFWFYAMFGVIVTSFVQIVGVLLVFSYLIIPAVCANYLALRLRAMLVVGWTVAILGSLGGLFASYRFDWPTGAAVVCALAAVLLIVMVIAAIRKPVPDSPR
jgi:zinc/manganese transport system permease protein